jgi:hypothetical protein
VERLARVQAQQSENAKSLDHLRIETTFWLTPKPRRHAADL